ncbi:hypothetical protein HLB44_10555 [Aquincola sp. S2]|uniref:Lipoprotein n=1 Tax=Pseudaquabacterium terrae TaxID=2732868 RepID=A0ABX2EFM1_9BURK|nr:hypothetical protein [Aquabacterium terrae]NRF67425.1 hypothetical protein [Aquabacterium terrae]
MKKHLLALAATALLAACGGGDEASESTTQTPAAAVAGLRTRLAAVRVQAISLESTAEQLLNTGESVYPTYFPGHKTTGTFAPFRFRYYPETGVYLGVVISLGMGYTMNGVYVMGGPFGSSPVYVGLVTDFITPVDPNPSPGPNNGCVDLALNETTGTRTLVDYRYTGALNGTATTDTLVVGPKTFEGNSAIETVVKTTGTLGGNAQNTEIHEFRNRTGDAQVTHYGSQQSTSNTVVGVSTTTTDIKTIATPPWTTSYYGLAAGASQTTTATDVTTTTTTTTFTIPGVPPMVNTSSATTTTTTTTKFVGRESVTVPAGTYSACKYESTIAGESGYTATSWYIDGKGIMVKFVLSGTAMPWTQEALSVKLNGQSL